MNAKILSVLVLLWIFGNCSPKQEIDKNQLKEEIRQTENAFRDMVREKGIAEGFYHYAAPQAVLYRNGSLIEGKDSIGSWLRKRVKGEMTLDWEPSYIEVSESGDLAYTYGNFTYVTLDSVGGRKETQGIFHTVWKRQQDGSWKYVWD